jgi:hypothetical protein
MQISIKIRHGKPKLEKTNEKFIIRWCNGQVLSRHLQREVLSQHPITTSRPNDGETLKINPRKKENTNVRLQTVTQTNHISACSASDKKSTITTRNHVVDHCEGQRVSAKTILLVYYKLVMMNNMDFCYTADSVDGAGNSDDQQTGTPVFLPPPGSSWEQFQKVFNDNINTHRAAMTAEFHTAVELGLVKFNQEKEKMLGKIAELEKDKEALYNAVDIGLVTTDEHHNNSRGTRKGDEPKLTPFSGKPNTMKLSEFMDRF